MTFFGEYSWAWTWWDFEDNESRKQNTLEVLSFEYKTVTSTLKSGIRPLGKKVTKPQVCTVCWVVTTINGTYILSYSEPCYRNKTLSACLQITWSLDEIDLTKVKDLPCLPNLWHCVMTLSTAKFTLKNHAIKLATKINLKNKTKLII